MPRQINYPDSPLNAQARPIRLNNFDFKLLSVGFKQVLFGQTENDLVEVYFYDSNNTIDSHINLYAPSDALSISTAVDVDNNTQQFLSIDLPKVAELTNLIPGRYSMVLNFFRDEIGSEAGNHLYIKDISESRTEIKLVPFNETPEIFREMYEFIVPSITKLYAQALVDEIFGRSLDALSGESITFNETISNINRNTPNIISRLNYSGTYNSFKSFIHDVILLTHTKTLDLIQSGDRNIQESELKSYIAESLSSAITDIKNSGFLNPKIELR